MFFFDIFSFLIGDARANQQPPLALIQIIWFREHNRIAAGLKISPKNFCTVVSSRLSMCSTARGSGTGFFLVGPTKVKALKSGIHFKFPCSLK